MKRIFCLVIALVLSFNFCLANVDSEVNEPVSMTLEEAIEYALVNNSSIIDLERSTKDQKELYDDAKTEYIRWKNEIRSGGYSFENEAEYLTSTGDILELSKLQYDSFMLGKEGAKLQVSYSVKNLIYSIFELKDNINLLEKNIIKQENDVEIANVKFMLNMITENELKNTKATLDTLRLNFNSAKDSLSSLEISLKQVMGFDVNKELVIKRPEYLVEELVVEDIDKVIDESLETNTSAISAKMQYKQKENNYILATKTSFLLKDEKKDAKRNFEDAEFRLNNEISSIKENLKLLYNQVKDVENGIKISKDEFERAKVQFEQAKVMYDVGLISKNSYLAYELSVINAEKSNNSKVKEGILLKDRFNIAISVGDIIAK